MLFSIPIAEEQQKHRLMYGEEVVIHTCNQLPRLEKMHIANIVQRQKFTEAEFEEKIKELHSDFEIDFDDENCIKIEEYTEGNRVKTIKIGNLELTGVEVRNIFGLRSANFTVTIEDSKIKFEVIGYGHGVGMSQTGADSLAKEGKTYEEIIHHYYTDVEIEDM